MDRFYRDMRLKIVMNDLPPTFMETLQLNGRETPVMSLESDKMQLPWFYDDRKFKLVHKLYVSNRFACIAAIICGFLALLSDYRFMRILRGLTLNADPLQTYKHCIKVFVHIISLFNVELYRGSSSWKSLEELKRFFVQMNRASKQSQLSFISQRDLALMQFCVIGFMVSRSRFLGICATDEQMSALCHYWHVIGSMVGLQDKYNLCGNSMNISGSRIQQVKELFASYLQGPAGLYEDQSREFVNGVRCFVPYYINYDSVRYFVSTMAEAQGYEYQTRCPAHPEPKLVALQKKARFMLYLMITIHSKVLHWYAGRVVCNLFARILEFFVCHFPYVALFVFEKCVK